MADAREFIEARQRLGMTQAELAEALGYGAATRISEIERGVRNPGPAARRLLRLLLEQQEREEIRDAERRSP